MPRFAIAAVLVVTAAPAFAQDGGSVAAPPTSSPPVEARSASGAETDALRREMEAKLDAARKEVKDLREEMRAQLATQSVAQGWTEDWVDEKRKLELFTADGYLRVRPDLFYKFDMGRQPDPAGYSLFPRSPTSGAERTNAGVNMRFRFEPTINVSEEVRIRAQIDALDNLVWGSTPDYAFSRGRPNNYWYDRDQFSVFSNSQASPASGVNSLTDSINVRRVWGEVSTPVGILRFGRMGSHWGTGMLHNDGNGIDADFGDTVDRVMFVAEPINGFYVTPMLDMNVEGILTPRTTLGGQQADASNSDDSHSYILAIARRDTETERLAKLDSGQSVFNYGLHFTYRAQRNDSIDYLAEPLVTDGTAVSRASDQHAWVQRNASLFMPDLWAKFERKNFRIEGEFASILGTISNRALTGGTAGIPGQNQKLDVWQFAAVVQGEYKFLNGDLEIGGEVGFASGDTAPGMGNYPRRNTATNGKLGAIDGPQYLCSADGSCKDNTLRAFRFNQGYRVDMILYRELLGGVTDSFYVKPKANYRITQGFNVFLSVLYARAIFPESTPSAGSAVPDANLGIEVNGGARYETEDGFFAQLQYGILFPLGGFAQNNDAAPGTQLTLDNPQALRGSVGIKF